MERGMRKVEQAVRDAETTQWQRTDPELTARAQSMVDQLEAAIADLQAKREKADPAKAAKLDEEITAKQAWLEQARGGLGN